MFVTSHLNFWPKKPTRKARPLAAFQGVLEGQGMEAEDVPQLLDLLPARVAEIEPKVLVALQQLGDSISVQVVEEAHAATLDTPPDAPGLLRSPRSVGPQVRQSRV